MKFFLIIIVSVIVFIFNSAGQPVPMNNKYVYPLNIPLSVSGTFGEIRSNTLHAGIDFRTQGKTGFPVYAVDSGYISRIKIEPGGYGRAIYITHSDSLVSVYAHLEKLRSDIDTYCKEEQYKIYQFGVDLSLPKNLFTLKKGDSIGFSGNAGASSGPHLHFEIRDEKTQVPLNIIRNLGFIIPDSVPPVIENLWVYPVKSKGLVNNLDQALSIPVLSSNGTATLSGMDYISVTGKFAFGIQTTDPSEFNMNKTGIYSIDLFIDTTLCFSQKADKISFSETRYCNSLIDYEQFIKSYKRINRLFIQPNNKLGVYSNAPANGIININDSLSHSVLIKVKDANLNTTELKFIIKGNNASLESFKDTSGIPGKLIACKTENIYENKNIRIIFSPNSLYDDIFLEYDTLPQTSEYYSCIHQVHNSYTPIHQPVILRITPRNLPEKLQKKALLVYVDKNRAVYGTGGYKNNYIEAQVRLFGNYAVAIDTIPPIIKPVNEKRNYSGETAISFKITDNLSGISNYRGLIDGKWVLFEYDSKNDLISYNFDSTRMEYGKKHTLDLFVTDGKNNMATYHHEFLK